LYLTSARVKDWCSNQAKVYLSKDFRPLAPKFGGTRKFNSSQSPPELGDLAIVSAKILSKLQIQALSKKESPSPDELLNEIKTAIANFYCTEEVTHRLVEYDRDGQSRSKILRFEAFLHNDLAIKSDVDAISKQAKFDRGIFIPDQPCYVLGSFIRDKLGLGRFLVPNVEYTNNDLATIGNI
jgi:hypothetical protein